MKKTFFSQLHIHSRFSSIWSQVAPSIFAFAAFIFHFTFVKFFTQQIQLFPPSKFYLLKKNFSIQFKPVLNFTFYFSQLFVCVIGGHIWETCSHNFSQVAFLVMFVPIFRSLDFLKNLTSSRKAGVLYARCNSKLRTVNCLENV